ncbi:phosphoadenosine phosphosulfate reductase family protein [Spirulina sp. CS-785/01]|nr:phosphoadenosine phosphosulfate reductase family protein [Spirulina sp. CS-785/01]MDB9314131.1 phosphoadenosine phosphosulfate reductase family protein [Spirulina sp. CS-785/01]
MACQTNVRHILGISGGKDSAALAVLLHQEIPQMEYFFCDTHKELPETYEFLERIQARLGIKIHYLSANQGFDHWLALYGGYLPSPQSRWCTRQMKIKPLEAFVGDDEAISYVAIRADENRDGYISTKPNIKPVYPFRDRGLVKADIVRLLEDSGIGYPDYYRWRSRSGCYFCFFQRKYEWVKLAEEHPDLFAKAVAYEQEHADGRTYTWTQGET